MTKEGYLFVRNEHFHIFFGDYNLKSLLCTCNNPEKVWLNLSRHLRDWPISAVIGRWPFFFDRCLYMLIFHTTE